MENVEVKKTEEVVKPAKKVAKKMKKDANKVKFMEHMNKKRKEAGMSAAYSEEEVKAYK